MFDSSQVVYFPPFRLDLAAGQLWCEECEIVLRAKTLAVLCYLVNQAGRFVSKEELLDAVWPDTYVSDIAPLICVRELRKAFTDDAKNPRFIQTMRRRGVRFIAKVVSREATESNSQESETRISSFSSQHSGLSTQDSVLVGREVELAHLRQLFIKTLSGQRQIIFVTGEPGIGKTTVVDAFLAGIGRRATGNRQKRNIDPARQLADASSLMLDLKSPILVPWIAWGQCIEHYGVGEAYRPVLDALGQLCRDRDGNHIIAVLKHYAPTWLLQMPSLLTTAELDEVQKRTQGSTRERMLREIVEALTILAAEKPLVFVLEDLHWSDPSTLDFLALLAQQREAAQLFIIGTYRPMEIANNSHPLCSLTQELFAHKQSEELPLPLLSEVAVTTYVTVRLEKARENITVLSALAQTVYQQTEGNPLFMVSLVDYWLTQNGTCFPTPLTDKPEVIFPVGFAISSKNSSRDSLHKNNSCWKSLASQGQNFLWLLLLRENKPH